MMMMMMMMILFFLFCLKPKKRERETTCANNRNDDRNEYYRLHSPTRAAKRPSMRRASVRSVTKETRGGFFFQFIFGFN